MKKDTFRDFLEEQYAKAYRGTDDDMPDAFDTWVTNTQIDELMDYADVYGDIMFKKGQDLTGE